MPSRTSPFTKDNYKAELVQYSIEDQFQLLSNLTYDLRSQVTPLLTGIALLRESDITQDSREQVLHEMLIETRNLLEIIEALGEYTSDNLIRKMNAEEEQAGKDATT